jgi:hypothetical protein
VEVEAAAHFAGTASEFCEGDAGAVGEGDAVGEGGGELLVREEAETGDAEVGAAEGGDFDGEAEGDAEDTAAGSFAFEERAA